MGEDEKFDVIIVGAGLAGSTAAYILAKAGLSVVVFERGSYPGAKNMFGGELYTTVLNKLIPDWWEEAPWERYICEHRLFFMSDKNQMSFSVRTAEHPDPPWGNTVTVLRSKFDQWFASKAEEAGAMLFTDTVVDHVLKKDGKIIGVRTRRDEGDLEADVVIIADGANSLLVERAGLRDEARLDQMAVGIKEVIKLPKDVIEQRFCLEGDEGASYKCFGAPTEGIWGTGTIYTNRESLGITLWTGMKALNEARLKEGEIPTQNKLNKLIEQFKQLPFIRKLVDGGETVEYMAHLVPDGGYHFARKTKLFSDGVMVVGDAASLVAADITGIHGTDIAMASGWLAADTCLFAKEKKDYSADTLSLYDKKLKDHNLWKDMKKVRNQGEFAQDNPEFWGPYTYLIADSAVQYFAVDERTKAQRGRSIFKNIFSGIQWIKLMVNGMKYMLKQIFK